jgi:hypothetical protein
MPTGLFFSLEVPLIPRVGIICGLMMNCALFFSSNFAAGTDVYPVVQFGDEQPIEFEPLFTFDLAGTIKDMWEAEVYPLALLVAIMSGVWPYTKLARCSSLSSSPTHPNNQHATRCHTPSWCPTHPSNQLATRCHTPSWHGACF